MRSSWTRTLRKLGLKKTQSERTRKRRRIVEQLEERQLLAFNFTEDFASYTGAGFSPNGSVAGTLNSNAWSARMGLPCPLTLAGLSLRPPPCRGTTRTALNAVTGLQAFSLNSNRMIGIQPTGSTFITDANGNLT